MHVARVVRAVPAKAREVWRDIVAQLADKAKDVTAARAAIQQLLGDSIIVHEKAGDLFAEITGSQSQINMVAGAGFEPATFGL